MRPNLFDTRAAAPARRLLAFALLFAAICALVAISGGRADASIAGKQDQLADVRNQQDNVADQIAAANEEINGLIGQVSEARQREEAAAAELADSQQELAQARDDLDAGRAHLQDVRKQLHRAVDQLEKILVGVYKSDDPDMIKLLLESTQWQDADVDAAYLDRLHDYQADTVQRVTDLRTEAADTVQQLADSEQKIEEQRDAIAQRQQELADVRAGLEAQESQLAAARADRRETLASLSGREDNLQTGIARAQRRQEQQQAPAVPPTIDPASGPAVAAPAPTAPAPAGGGATLNSDGSASPPADAPPAVKAVIEAANQIKDAPYSWGGGHGSFESSGYDCSGAISFALHGGGLLSSPLDSTGFGFWGEPGVGNWITVYGNSGHAYAVIAGLRWDTSGTGGSGPSWSTTTTSFQPASAFVARHPAGL